MEELRVEQNRSTNKEELRYISNFWEETKVISRHRGDKCVEEVLDGSVRILDMCGLTKDTILQIKENVQALHSGLRRSKGHLSVETSVAKYKLSPRR
ncbi:hypothetical protein JHK86_045252 [Glycine max]|nr:hypothetical protein JHK86_045252 [Glycine max]